MIKKVKCFLWLLILFLILGANQSFGQTKKENIKFLKILFHIQPGDFHFHNKKEIEATIASQLSRIYQDSYITDEEALLKVDLQEIFDLSFDEMNDYSKVEASISIQKGTDPKHLDVFFTNKEYFKLK